jgi:hypothetical protein
VTIFDRLSVLCAVEGSTLRRVGEQGKCRREKSWSYAERFTPLGSLKHYLTCSFINDYSTPKVAYRLHSRVSKAEVSVH